jgi:DNA-binding transcriptional LysR family regulator
MDMDFHQLLVFTKVVEHKSFSKAAVDIFLSQSTVSSHIQSLEKMLNTSLFDRVGREVILTQNGERLYDWALKILNLKDEALLDIHNGKTILSGIIKIAASSVPSQFILPKMIKEFRTEYEASTFQITQSPSKSVAEKVLNGSVDVGILGEKYEHSKLEYIPLLKEKLVVISAKNRPLLSPVKLEDISHLPFVLRNAESGTNAILEKHLKAKRIAKDQLNVVTYTDCGQSLIQLVKEDIGISIISEMVAREYHNAAIINMYEVEDIEEDRNFYLVYNTDKTQSMLTKLFIEMAVDGVTAE